MFSEATYPHSEQVVSPLVSSESQELAPQIMQDPAMDSVFLFLEGLTLSVIALLRELTDPDTAFFRDEFRALVLSVKISTSSCIVSTGILKRS